MSQMSRIATILRWVSAPCASVAAFFVALQLSYELYFRSYDLNTSGSLPPASAALTGGFILGFFTVLAGSIVAPFKRVAVAASVFLLCAGLYVVFAPWAWLPTGGLRLHPHSLSACAGGLAGIGFIAWWVRPHRASWKKLWVTLGAIVAFAAVAYAQYLDLPAWSDPLPFNLRHALGKGSTHFTAFYLYDLGGLFDTQSLWRIDANSKTIALVVSRLHLQKVHTVPQRFWRRPPYYWPRSMIAGAEAFQSPMFYGDERGPDGSHYFLLHDKTQGRAYVWVKDNF